MDITQRLKALGYEKSGSFCKGIIYGRQPFGKYGHTVFNILLDVKQGNEIATKHSFPKSEELSCFDSPLSVDEMQLALEIIYCYRKWKTGCPKCMHFDNEDFKCTSCMKGE